MPGGWENKRRNEIPNTDRLQAGQSGSDSNVTRWQLELHKKIAATDGAIKNFNEMLLKHFEIKNTKEAEDILKNTEPDSQRYRHLTSLLADRERQRTRKDTLEALQQELRS